MERQRPDSSAASVQVGQGLFGAGGARQGLHDNLDVYRRSDEARHWIDQATAPLTPDEELFLARHLSELDVALLDCGCGAGRIAYNLESRGFTSIAGYDFSPEMLRAAESARPAGSSVRFHLADATTMTPFAEACFDATLCLQQLLCFVPPDKVDAALNHAVRVTRPGGILLFSALNFEARRINRLLSATTSVARRLRGEPPEPQLLPWLTFGSQWNWSYLGRGQPSAYWFRRDELAALLAGAGLEIVELLTSRQLQGRHAGPEGKLYAACRRPL